MSWLVKLSLLATQDCIERGGGVRSGWRKEGEAAGEDWREYRSVKGEVLASHSRTPLNASTLDREASMGRKFDKSGGG